MSLNIIYGPASSGKTTKLYNIINDLSINQDRKVTVIVPNQFCMSAEMELVRLSGNGIMKTEVLSFNRLAYRLMEEAGRSDLPLLDDMGKKLILRHIIKENDEKLSVFKGKERNAGFIDEMKSLVSELSQYCIRPEDITKAKTEHDSFYDRKLSDIETIYSSYLKKTEGIYKTAENTLEMCYPFIGRSEFLKNNILVLDGFTGLTPTQYDLMSRVLTVCKDIYISLTGDENLIDTNKLSDGFISFTKEPGIFGMSVEMGEKMVELCASNGITVKDVIYTDYNYNCKDITHLKNNIFRNEAHSPLTPQDIEIHALSDVDKECHYVAATIADLLRTKNYQYKDIAIVTGNIKGMAPSMCRALNEYGIEYYFDERKEIASNPLVGFISSALSVVENDYRHEDVMNFISSPLSGISEKSAAIFDNYLYAYGYRGVSQYKKEWAYTKRYGVKTFDLDDVNAIREKLVNSLLVLPRGNSKCHDLIVSIYNFLKSYNAKEVMEELSLEIEDEYLNKCLIKEYRRVYGDIIAILEQIDALMGEEEITIREFRDLLMAGIKLKTEGYLPDRPDLVIYGDIYRTRISDIKVLFLIDAVEGVIPRSQGNDTILTFDDRCALEEKNVKLAPQIKNNPDREEYYIYLSLAKPSDKLYITYSSLNASGESVKPSYIIDSIKKPFSEIRTDYGMPDTLSAIVGHDKGYSYVIKSALGDNKDNDDELYKALVSYYRSSDNNEDKILSDIKTYIATFFNENIKEETARDLYKTPISCSVSRMETYAECPFRHFMNYGIAASERNHCEHNNMDYGNTLHAALESFMNIYKGDLTDFSKITDSEISANALRCLKAAISNYDENFYTDNPKNEYIASRMERVMLTTADALIHQLRKSKFKIVSLEDRLNVEDDIYKISGKIDRIDKATIDGRNMIKIIDYKTGSQSLDFNEVYYGLNLQLMVYMDYVLKKYPDSAPAAAFYQSVTEPMLNSLEGGSGLKDITRESLIPSGRMTESISVNDALDNACAEDDKYVASYSSDVIGLKTTKSGTIDATRLKANYIHEEDLTNLSKYATKKLLEFGKEMYKGTCSVSPAAYGTKSGCDYCPYANICGFDKKNPMFTDKINVLKKLDRDEIFEEIKNK